MTSNSEHWLLLKAVSERAAEDYLIALEAKRNGEDKLWDFHPDAWIRSIELFFYTWFDDYNAETIIKFLRGKTVKEWKKLKRHEYIRTKYMQ